MFALLLLANWERLSEMGVEYCMGVKEECDERELI
jgi:hypothetical protein